MSVSMRRKSLSSCLCCHMWSLTEREGNGERDEREGGEREERGREEGGGIEGGMEGGRDGRREGWKEEGREGGRDGGGRLVMYIYSLLEANNLPRMSM